MDARTAAGSSILDAWARAETSLGRTTDEASASEQLPHRLKWIFLAMNALEHGERKTIQGVVKQASDAGALDVAWILTLVLADPSTLDPTSVRKQAKRDGAGADSELPILDLLRLMTSWRGWQGATERAPSLARVARERPVLRWVLAQLQRRRWQPPLSSVGPQERADGAKLRALSPRIIPLWIACDAKQEGYAPPSKVLLHLLPRTEASFPHDRWPDLDEPVTRRPGVDWFLAEPLATTWSDALRTGLVALRAGPVDRRRAALRALLLRIDHDLRHAPQPLRALPIVRTAMVLAECTNGLELLAIHLLALEMRMTWFIPGQAQSIEMLEALWSRLRDRTAAERRAVASCVHEIGTDSLPPPLERETALCLLSTATGSREREMWTERFGARLPRASVEQTLRETAGIADTELLYLLGLCDVRGGRERAALEAAVSLLERPPAVENGIRLLSAALASGGRGLRGASGAKAIQRAVAACARAPLRRCDAATLLPALQDAVDAPRYDAFLSLLRPAAAAPLTRVESADSTRDRLLDPDVAFDLLGWELLGEGETAARLFRELGRLLRSEPSAGGHREVDGGGDGLALRVVIRLIAYRGLTFESGQPKRWIDALNAFLVRNGAAPLAARVARLDIPPLLESRDGFGLAAWLLSSESARSEGSNWEEIARKLGLASEKRWARGARYLLDEMAKLLPGVPERPLFKRFMSSVLSGTSLGDIHGLVVQMARQSGLSPDALLDFLADDELDDDWDDDLDDLVDVEFEDDDDDGEGEGEDKGAGRSFYCVDCGRYHRIREAPETALRPPAGGRPVKRRDRPRGGRRGDHPGSSAEE